MGKAKGYIQTAQATYKGARPDRRAEGNGREPASCGKNRGETEREKPGPYQGEDQVPERPGKRGQVGHTGTAQEQQKR